MATKKIPIAVVLLAAGYKAAREGTTPEVATQEIIGSLPTMGREVDYSASGKEEPLAAVSMPFNPLTADEE